MSKLCALHFIDASIDILIQLKTMAALISAVSERQVFVDGEFYDNTILESVLQTNGAKAVWVHDFSSLESRVAWITSSKKHVNLASNWYNTECPSSF